MGIFGFFTVVYYFNDRQRWKYTREQFSNVGGVEVMYIFFIFALVCLGLAILNAILSLMGTLVG